MDKQEIATLKAGFGCDSRRLNQIYNETLGHPASADLCEAAQRADEAYEALKRVLEHIE